MIANDFAAAAAATAAVAKGWPDPAPIQSNLPPAPVFDAHTLLPGVLADFVLDEADRMPCAPDYIGAALMVAAGAVVSARCAIKPKSRDDWIVTPNLYGGVVGEPSQKKTPSVNVALRFLDRLESEENEKLPELLRTHEAEKAAYAARQGAVQSAMKKAAGENRGKGDSLAMNAAVADMADLLEPVEPNTRRFKTNDATTEKMALILAKNPTGAGILVFRDELMGLLSSWEKDGHDGDRAFYLEGHNGTGSFSVDRIGRGSIHIESFCLSVFGGIQPDLLERYLSNIVGSMDNDGRIQRFQMLVYPEPVKWEWRDRYPVQGAREAVRDLFERLAAFDPVQNGAQPANDFVKLPHFCFDPAAQELFIEWSTDLHLSRIAGEQNAMMAQHLGKFEKLFCAVALILHLAQDCTGPVSLETAMRAAAWCEYLEAHARRIYGLIDAAKVTAAKTIARQLSKGKLVDGFTARDVSKKGWAGIATSQQAEAALTILQEHGWLDSYDTEDLPGRPTTRYYINPKIGGTA